MALFQISYLTLAVLVVLVVARTLYRNGREFLVDVFAGNAGTADAVNRMLVVGFCLVNAAAAVLALRHTPPIPDGRVFVELLGEKIGLVLMTLGGMHLMNLLFFCAWRAGHVGDRTRRDVHIELR